MKMKRSNRERKEPARMQAKKLTKRTRGASQKKPSRPSDEEAQNRSHLFDSPLVFSADREDEEPPRASRGDDNLFDRSILSSEI